jgi:hypothetical protein
MLVGNRIRTLGGSARRKRYMLYRYLQTYYRMTYTTSRERETGNLRAGGLMTKKSSGGPDIMKAATLCSLDGLSSGQNVLQPRLVAATLQKIQFANIYHELRESDADRRPYSHFSTSNHD